MHHYTYRVTWSDEDGEFVGTCDELPSLSWLAATTDDAMDGIRRIVLDTVEDLARAGERVP